MKKHLTAIFLILLSVTFCVFIILQKSSKEVLSVISPVKFGIDLNNDKVISNEEIICAGGIESFSLEPSEDFVRKYSKDLNLTSSDIISLGYLAQEFARKQIQNQKVTLKYTDKVTSECKYADVRINGTEYSSILEHSGFGIKNGKITEPEKYKRNLEKARKLHLVVLNHHSNKYHTLDCKYGKLAHDKVLLPFSQLPEGAIPCRYCHKKKFKKKHFKAKYIYDIPNIKAPPLIHSDGNIALYYTDFTKHLKPDNKCLTNECKALINLINNSRENIDIAIYGYDEVPAVTQALKKANSRGVKIRYVYDEPFDSTKVFFKDNGVIKDIASVSVSDRNAVPSKSNMLMHNKFVIFDNSVVFTGSMNFSKSGFSGYDQNDVIIIHSKEVSQLYEEEFKQMLEGHFHKDKIKNSSSNRFKIGNSELEVYFSPQDRSAKRVVQILNGSKKYIYIPAFLITHEKITNALIAAHKRGVDVKIILDANSTSIRNTKHKILRENGIPLKTENYAGKLHSKTMIADDKYIIAGSMNFSNSGENKNDENMLVITNPKLAKAYSEFFIYLWKMVPDKYLKFNVKPESRESIGSCSDGVDNNFNGLVDSADKGCK